MYSPSGPRGCQMNNKTRLNEIPVWRALLQSCQVGFVYADGGIIARRLFATVLPHRVHVLRLSLIIFNHRYGISLWILHISLENYLLCYLYQVNWLLLSRFYFILIHPKVISFGWISFYFLLIYYQISM